MDMYGCIYSTLNGVDAWRRGANLHIHKSTYTKCVKGLELHSSRFRHEEIITGKNYFDA